MPVPGGASAGAEGGSVRGVRDAEQPQVFWKYFGLEIKNIFFLKIFLLFLLQPVYVVRQLVHGSLHHIPATS